MCVGFGLLIVFVFGGAEGGLLHGNRLGQVPWAVDVAAAEDGQMVGEELHGDHSQNGLQGVHSLGHLVVRKKIR